MKKNKRFIPLIIAYGVLLVLLLPIFVYAILAYSNPAKYNYRLDYLQAGEAVDGYLHTGEYALTLVFLGLLFAGLTLGLLSWIFRRKSTQIAVSCLLSVIAFSYCLARSVYCFGLGGTNSIPAIFYLIGALGIACSLVFFVKKTLDGDCSWLYYVSVILGAAFLFLASCTKYSYSILNALGHQGDVVYWGSYGVSRIALLSYLLGAYLNLSLDYEPEAK